MLLRMQMTAATSPSSLHVTAPGLAWRSPHVRLADLDRLSTDDTLRYEILKGELVVTPAPRRSHMAVAARLVNLIGRQLVTDSRNWSMAIQPINLAYETDEVTYQCQPDLSVFNQPLEAVVADESLQPVIVIEIVSPGNPENDYIWKVEAYARMGMPEYWIVDPGNVAITFLRLITGAQANHYEQIPASGLLPGLTVVPDQLFAGI
jgi:Uma2 family endonuclease